MYDEPSYSSQIEFLHYCAMGDQCLDDVKNLFLKNRMILHAKNAYQDNALILSVREKNNNIMKFLVEEAGICLEDKNEQGSAIFHAIIYDNYEAFKYLLNNGLLMDKNNFDENILFPICASGKDKYMEYLIERYDFEKPNNLTLTTTLQSLSNDLNVDQEHCLFHWCKNYIFHKNDYLFDLLLNYMTPCTLNKRNKQDQNIKEKLYEMDKTINMKPILNLLAHHGFHQ